MDSREFKDRVLPHYSHMWAVAMTMLRNSEDARDTVQDAVVRLWEHRSELWEVTNIEAYCITVTRRIALDRLRHQSRQPERPIDSLPELVSDTDASQLSEYSETLTQLKQCIAGLPTNQARVIILYAWRGCDTEQICEITGFSAANVRQLLSRARKALRNSLDN